VRAAWEKHADGPAVGARGNPSVFGFYATKQITTGRGDDHARGGLDEGADGLKRNPGRVRDMGWLDHDRLGFNYRLSEIAYALGIAQLEPLDEMLAGRASVADLYCQALGRTYETH
jgi:perosamine synthetase